MTRRRLWWGLLGLVLLAAIGLSWAAPFPYQHEVLVAARHNRLNPLLVAAVIRTESSFRPHVESRRGAVGLMQLMPSTGRWIQTKMGASGNLWDPRVNVAVGAWYLRYLLNRYHGHVKLALAAYNSGPEVVDVWLQQKTIQPSVLPSSIPYPETRDFVTRVLAFYWLYRIVYVGFPH